MLKTLNSMPPARKLWLGWAHVPFLWQNYWNTTDGYPLKIFLLVNALPQLNHEVQSSQRHHHFHRRQSVAERRHFPGHCGWTPDFHQECCRQPGGEGSTRRFQCFRYTRQLARYFGSGWPKCSILRQMVHCLYKEWAIFFHTSASTKVLASSS